MTLSNRRAKAFAERSLWLEVTGGTDRRVFELAAGDDRAIVVGSMPGAQVRLAGSKIAPVAFHFERESDGVRLVPGIVDELRLDDVRVFGPRLLSECVCVDLPGFRLLVRVLQEPPTSSGSTLASTGPVGIDYLAALPTDTADTAAYATFSAVQSTSTVSGAAPTASQTLLDAGDVLYGPQGTEVVRVADLRQPHEPWAKTERVEVQQPPPPSPATTGDTTAFETPVVAGPDAWCDSPSPDSSPLCVTRAGPLSARVVEARPGRRSSLLLAEIDALAKRYPVAIGAGTVVGGLALALALSGIRHMQDGAVAQRTVPPAAAVPQPSSGVQNVLLVSASVGSSNLAPLGAFTTLPPAPAAPERARPVPSVYPHDVVDADVVAAVNDLAAGRIPEARLAYARLAERSSKDPAVTALARLLGRAADAQCSTSGNALKSCPELKR